MHSKVKKIVFFSAFFLFFFLKYSFSQNNLGINTTNPYSKAALDVRNSAGFSQGILIPRLPQGDSLVLETGISANEKGLMFFDSDNNVLRYWNGTKWVSLAGTAGTSEWTRMSSQNYVYATSLSGRVSIGGNTNPVAKLQVVDLTNPDLLTLSGGNGSMEFSIESLYNQLSSRNFNGSNARSLYLNASMLANRGLILTPDGNLGIGLTNPLHRIHLDVTETESAIFVRQQGNGNAIQGNNYSNGNGVQGIASGTGAGVNAWSTGTGPAFLAEIQGTGTGPSGIFMGGSVGIGTTSPASRFQVADNSKKYAARIDQNGGGGDGLLVYANTSSDTATIFYATGNGTGLIVKGDGMVGINTTTPQSTLHVNGPIATKVTSRTVVSNYTIKDDESIVVKGPNGNSTYTLPAPVAGKMVIVVNNGALTSGNINIDGLIVAGDDLVEPKTFNICICIGSTWICK